MAGRPSRGEAETQVSLHVPPGCQRPSVGEESPGRGTNPTSPTTELAKGEAKGSQSRHPLGTLLVPSLPAHGVGTQLVKDSLTERERSLPNSGHPPL